MISPRNILVATDFGEASQAALDQGRSLATAFNAQLHLLHVVAEPLSEPWVGYTPGAEFGALLEKFEADARGRLESLVAADDVDHRAVVIATTLGDPADEVLEYANHHEIDLIVCGTHGRQGWKHFAMGSVAERIVRDACCPVLVVRAAADRTRTAA